MENNLKIATPISHLFENENISFQIIDLSDCLECRDHSLNKGFKKQDIRKGGISALGPNER